MRKYKFRHTEEAKEKLREFHLGRKASEETKLKMSLTHKGRPTWNKGIKMVQNEGKNNGQWKGDQVGYLALHEWVRNHLTKPQTCRDCNKPKKLDLANISQKYLRDLSDWEWLCRKCHMTKDGRIANLKKLPRDYAGDKNPNWKGGITKK
jgi:hypothetical protein